VCNLYSNYNEPGAIIALVPRDEPVRRQPAPMPACFQTTRLRSCATPAASAEMVMIALGHATAATCWRLSGYQHQEHRHALRTWLSRENRCLVPANSLPNTRRSEPGDQEERRGVVCAQR